MNITLYTGAAGTGKTEKILSEIKEHASNGRTVTLFVPDQFSFETERLVYSYVGAQNISRVKVTFFSRVARKILTDCHLAKPYADDVVKQITMFETVNSVKDSLTFYKNINAGFPKSLLKTVSSFRNAGITPDGLRKRLNEETSLSPSVSDKLSDLLTIYDAYDRALTLSLDDRLDDIRRAAEAARANGYFNGGLFYFDNFDTFSGSQLHLLSVIFAQCEATAVTLLTDDVNSVERRFRCVGKTYSRLEKIASDEGAALSVVKLEKPFRAENMDSVPLEIFRAKNPYRECDFIAAQIRSLAIEKNARYRDVLVLTAEKSYCDALSASLSRYEIPFFCDSPQSLLSKPLIGFILTLLDALSLNSRDILRYINSGFVRITDENNRPLKSSEAARLNRTAERLHFHADEFSRQFEKSDDEEAEKLRTAVAEPLIRLRKAFEAAENGAEQTALLVRFLLDELNLKAAFIARSKTGDGEGTDYLETDKAKAEEYSRIWENLTAAFDSVAFCLRNTRTEVPVLRSLLENIFAGMALANPPAVLDCVTVGDIERTRKYPPKYVFVCGLNEGVVPRRPKASAAFSPSEQEQICEAGIEVGESRSERYFKELFFAYRAMTLAREKLFLTFSEQDFTGNELAPSQLINKTGAAITDVSSLPAEFAASTAAAAKRLLSEVYGNGGNAEKALTEALDNEREFILGLKTIWDGVIGKGYNFELSPPVARLLFSFDGISPSALEKLFMCPFRYFCDNGLGVGRREEADVSDNLEAGNAIHFTMQTTLEKYSDDFDSFIALPPEAMTELAESGLSAYADRYLQRHCDDEQRIRYILGAYTPRAAMMLMQLQSDFRLTGFRPYKAEQSVSYRLENDTLAVVIKGRADRIDRLKKPDGSGYYVRVCDYKTGISKKLNPDEIVQGVNMQMFIYLFACCENGDTPAGVEYVFGRDETITKCGFLDDFSREDRLKKWFSEHKLVASAIGGDYINGIYDSLGNELKNHFARGKETRKYIDLESMTESEFDVFREYCEQELILPVLGELLDGKIPALPLADASDDGKEAAGRSCGFCEYRHFCNNKDGEFGTKKLAKGVYEKIIKGGDDNA